MKTVVAIGTLDTKGGEYEFLRDQIRKHGADVLMVDVGVLGEPTLDADVSREEVAAAADADLSALVTTGDRGSAIETMAEGAGKVLTELYTKGRLDGVIALGGTGGSALAAQAMRELPIGVAKLLVSTVASGDTSSLVGETDITMMHSVVDIAGLNRISVRIISNSAAAIVGMAGVQPPELEVRPMLAASMFGVTTPCITVARELLERRGYEVLVFHQTGVGGRSMEKLISAGYFAGVLDVTTTELADELVGGVFPACPDRLGSAGGPGLPRVVSLGALDMVNFGPKDTVPAQFRGRTLHTHNQNVTLMRTTPDECAELGHRLATKLNASFGPTAVFVPLRGISMISTEGQPFHDPVSDSVLFETLRQGLSDEIELHELDLAINDPQFARVMAERLDELIEGME